MLRIAYFCGLKTDNGQKMKEMKKDSWPTVRLLLLILLFFCMAQPSFAQTSDAFSASGELLDSISSQPEPYATVRLLQPGVEKPVATALSDISGKFKVAAKKAGTYQLTVSSIGKKPVAQTIRLSSRPLHLGRILMAADAYVLGAAKVKATKPLVKAEVDKISYSIADDPDAQTNTTLEMLRKVPMVTVDGEDNIQVNGSSSFKVYVNGKPNQMMSANPSEIFKTYPATAIKKIEVITNPGAKYDAEGVAGVLNIITNTDTKIKGYNFSPSLRINNNGISGSFFGITQLGKFTLSANYASGYNDRPESVTESERTVFADATNHFLRENTTNKQKGVFHWGHMDGSYEIDSCNLISFSGGIRGYTGRTYTNGAYQMYSENGNLVYGYNMNSHTKSRMFDVDASADYQHTFKADQTLTLSYQFNTSPFRQRVRSTYSDFIELPFSLTDQYSDQDRHSSEHTGQLDFTTPFGKHHKLSTGLKYIYRLNKSDNEEEHRTSGTDDPFETDNEKSLRYRHRGDIAAAYAEYNYTLEHFTAMAGARYEYYHVKVTYPDGKRDAFSTNISNLVPSVRFGYNLSETQMIKWGYNMRISRPGIEALSPYVFQNTPETKTYGNPNLKSSQAHNIELSYSIFKPKFNFSPTLTYNFSNNGMTSYSFIDGDGAYNTTYDNFLHEKSLNLNIYLNWTIVDGTSVNMNTGGRYYDAKVKQMNLHNSGWSGYCWGGISQQLPAKIKADLWVGYSTPNVTLQGTDSKFYMYNLSLSRTFLKEDRLRLSLRAGNFIGRYHHFRNKTVTDDFSYVRNTRVDFLRLGFGITYRLGSLNANVKRVSRSIENNDRNSGGNSQQESSGSSM